MIGQTANQGNRLTIVLIVAMAENRVIGRAGTLPWRLPADLQRFKRLTVGHPIVMGRNTFESIGRALPQRQNIVLTRDPSWSHEGVEPAEHLEQALEMAEGEPVYVIGGEQVYRQALPLAQRIELTLVHAEVAGDAFFPPLDAEQWKLAERQDRPADEKNEYAMSFLTYIRREVE